MAIRRSFIRGQVRDLLARCGISARPINPAQVAKHLGIEIFEQPSSDNQSDISGCLVRTSSGAAIGVNPSENENRIRFTIAHEIGHFLLHQGERFHFDKTPSFRVNFRDSVSATGRSAEEVEANLFAAELLMPASLLTSEVDERQLDLLSEDDDALRQLASDYGVSVQALTFRLINLGLLPSKS